MREAINIIVTLLFRGIRNPPPTGIELIFTAFVRILTLGFAIAVSIRNILEVGFPLSLFFALHMLIGVPILYAMLEGQFALVEHHRKKSDHLSKVIVFNSIAVFSAMVIGILWLISVIW